MATRPDEAKVWGDPVLSLSSDRPCGREWHKLPTKIFNFCSIKNNREHNQKRRSGKWKIVTIFLCSLSSSLYQTIFQISSIDCVLINSQWLTKDALLLDYLVCCPIIVYCRLLPFIVVDVVLLSCLPYIGGEQRAARYQKLQRQKIQMFTSDGC